MPESLADNYRYCQKDTMPYQVKFTKEPEGWVVAEVPELPACFSQGRTEAEALANIQEAIAAWLWAEDQKRVEPTPSS